MDQKELISKPVESLSVNWMDGTKTEFSRESAELFLDVIYEQLFEKNEG